MSCFDLAHAPVATTARAAFEVKKQRKKTHEIGRAVLIGDFNFMIREMYFMVFMKKNVVIIIEHTCHATYQASGLLLILYATKVTLCTQRLR